MTAAILVCDGGIFPAGSSRFPYHRRKSSAPSAGILAPHASGNLASGVEVRHGGLFCDDPHYQLPALRDALYVVFKTACVDAFPTKRRAGAALFLQPANQIVV